jgi:hypothetical protein
MEGNGGGPSPSANRRTAEIDTGPSRSVRRFGRARIARQIRDLARSIYDRITVAGREIAGVRLIQAAYSHRLALALPGRLDWRARQVLGAR